MKPIRTYEIKVLDFPPVKYCARSPQQAQHWCWEEYTNADAVCSYKDFLKISTIRVVPNDPGTGDRIMVGGVPATRLLVYPVNKYVAFMRDHSDAILFSHPMDVQPMRLSA